MMFFVPAWQALQWRQADVVRSARIDVPWALVWFTFTLLIGYRYQVGGDWLGYRIQYFESSGPFSEVITESDPAYAALNWISVYFGWDIFGVNLVCGALFSAGLVAFCRAQPRPWLALTVAIPYLVIVVAMGYSRQAVAIGLVMPAFVNLAKNKNVKFVFWIAFAALFHKSAVVLAPLAIIPTARGRWWVALWVGGASFLLYVLLLQESQDTLISSYITDAQQSEGATVRVFMNAVPAFIFLIFRKRLVGDAHERGVWTWIAILAIGFVPLLVVSPSSTAVDRVALYLIPLQIYVLPRLPGLAAHRQDQGLITVFVTAYSALVQFVWLNFAVYAGAWVPYRFYPIELLFS